MHNSSTTSATTESHQHITPYCGERDDWKKIRTSKHPPCRAQDLVLLLGCRYFGYYWSLFIVWCYAKVRQCTSGQYHQLVHPRWPRWRHQPLTLAATCWEHRLLLCSLRCFNNQPLVLQKTMHGHHHHHQQLQPIAMKNVCKKEGVTGNDKFATNHKQEEHHHGKIIAKRVLWWLNLDTIN